MVIDNQGLLAKRLPGLPKTEVSDLNPTHMCIIYIYTHIHMYIIYIHSIHTHIIYIYVKCVV